MSAPTIRLATSDDAAAMAELYNHYVRDTIVTFEEVEVSASDMAGRLAAVTAASLPWIVVADQSKVHGYAYASPWRPRSAYRFSTETTVYLAADAVGRGLGTSLYVDLLARLDALGVHVALGGIALPNDASVALHEKCGFRKVAHLHEVGRKFDRWIDVGYWQRSLDAPAGVSAMTLASVCVYCASSIGADQRYAQAARDVGTALATRGIRLVYGGGRVGLMGVLADAALAAGGHVTGIIPAFLHAREVHHTGVTELIIVESMHQRKAEMASRADAFLALPGGFGTFEELFEVITWTQLDLQRKPVGLLNVAGFYDALITFIDQATAARLVREEHRAILSSADDVDELIGRLEAWAPSPTPKWRGELS